MHDFEIIQAQAKRFRKPTCVVKELPLLSQLIHEMPKTNFSDHSFLFIQHFLAAFPARLDLMIREGLAPDRTWFLDIPYSTNSEVYKRIDNMFRNRVPEPYTHPFGDYSNDQLNRLDAVLDNILQWKGKTSLVVIDDGAYFAKQLSRLRKSDPKRANEFNRAVIVEQTTRGHRFLESSEGYNTLKSLNMSAVSVARSKTKLQFEAPFIGVAIADSVVDALESRSLEPRNALILGFGSVGSATAFALRSRYQDLRIDVLEIESPKLELARNNNFRVHQTLPTSVSDCLYDLIVGCTGHRTFRPSDRSILSDSALLISGSSAAVEFDRKNFVDQADAWEDDDFRVLTNRQGSLSLHTNIEFEHGTKGHTFTIINAGFPVNFQGAISVLPTELIEPTHCLMFAATVEAMNNAQVGLTGLAQEWDCRIHDMARWVLDTC